MAYCHTIITKVHGFDSVEDGGADLFRVLPGWLRLSLNLIYPINKSPAGSTDGAAEAGRRK